MCIRDRYCDVMVRRWQDHSAKKATRESDGVAFDDTGNSPICEASRPLISALPTAKSPQAFT